MNIKYVMSRLGLFALALMAPLALAAEPVSITGIEVSNITPEKQVIKINFSGDAPSPASFSINTPPRIAFDFANTTNQSGKSAVPVSSNVLRLINIAEGTGRTRIVLNLNKQAMHEAKTEGKTVLITVDSAVAGGATPQPVHFSLAKANDQGSGIQNVDFRRGTAGEGKIVVDLSSPNVGIDIRQQGKNLVVDFAKAALPRKLERRLDVSDFGTPVQKIDALAQGDATKLVIEPKGNWEYSAYQTENRFTIEVREKVDESKLPASQKNYKGDKLSLNFQNVEVRTVLQVLAEFTGLNIITSDSVKGEVTLRLKDVPWDQAMDIILQARGLDMRKSGNVVWIAPRDELAAKEKQELEAKKQIAGLVPTRQETFRLKYQKAADIEKIIKGDKSGALLSKEGSVAVDVMTNLVIINDVPEKLENIRDLIAKTDTPPRQVMIEARIVEAREGFSRELGAKLSFSRSGTTNTYGATLSNVATNLPTATNYNTLTATFGSILGNTIDLELNAMEVESDGKIISSPRLLTADRVEAVIEDGQEIPYTTTTTSGGVTTTNVAFKKAVLSLKVTPQITPDGNVIMDVKVNKDSRADTTSAVPPIDTKLIQTKVLVENGGTAVIGGIYIQDTSNSVQQVPLLGRIPVLGYLFKQEYKNKTKRELLIFITPKVLTQDLALQ